MYKILVLSNHAAWKSDGSSKNSIYKSALLNSTVLEQPLALTMQLAILKKAFIPIVFVIICPIKYLSTITFELVVFEFTVINEVFILESTQALFDSIFHLATV